MTRPGTFVLSALGCLFAASSLPAQDLTQYRDISLGSTVAEVATATRSDDVKVVHQRPALIQQLRWRPSRYGEDGNQADPVREVLFTFYSDQLFMIVVDYDRQRTAGLTDADLIEVLTDRYGLPVLKATSLPNRALPEPSDQDSVVARWADTTSSISLLRGTYPTSLRLVLALKGVEALARTASAEAVRKDDQEAPQRELDRRQQQAEDVRLAEAKARIANKAGFTP